jgi:hypothetical protein
MEIKRKKSHDFKPPRGPYLFPLLMPSDKAKLIGYRSKLPVLVKKCVRLVLSFSSYRAIFLQSRTKENLAVSSRLLMEIKVKRTFDRGMRGQSNTLVCRR